MKLQIGFIRSEPFYTGAVRRLIISVLLILSASGVPGYAFEVGKFRSGMNAAEALRVARGYEPRVELADSPAEGLSILEFPEHSDGVLTAKWSLGFCYRALFSVYRKSVFSWPSIIETISRLNKRYGEGKVRPLELDLVGIGIVFDGIMFVWENSVESIEINMWRTDIVSSNPENRTKKEAMREIWPGTKGMLTAMYILKEGTYKECGLPKVRKP